MKVYLAGERSFSGTTPDGTEVNLYTKVKRRLFSYFYHGRNGGLSADTQESYDHGHDLFLDSGAFSAFTSGATIGLEEYADFIQRHGEMFNLRANLDVIGDDGSKSWDNWKALEGMGCDVFPVFHIGDDIKWLHKILDTGYPMLALGGLVGVSRKARKEWLDDIWEKHLTDDQGKAIRSVHGFGFTDLTLMLRYPWGSVDSSTWLMSGIFGRCLLRVEQGSYRPIVFSEESPEAQRFKGWHYDRLAPQEKTLVDACLIETGVTAKQCASFYLYRDLVNAITYTSMEQDGVDTFKQEQKGLF